MQFFLALPHRWAEVRHEKIRIDRGNRSLRIFVYEEELARFATEEYHAPAISKEHPNFVFKNVM